MKKSAPHEMTAIGLGWPIFVEQGLRILIGTVDTFMLSYVSDEAVAAVGVAHQVITMGLFTFGFIGIGTSVVITHHLGANDRPGADRVALAAVGVNNWVGVLVSLLIVGFRHPILHGLGLPPELALYALPFLTVMGGTLVVEAQNTAMTAVLRAHGKTRDAMLVGVSQNILNLIGNALLLFGWLGLPRLGVLGVAISGSFSRLCSHLVLRALVHHRTSLRVGWRHYFAWPMDCVRRILRIGLPAAGERLLWSLALMAVTTFIAQMGSVHLATFSYTRQLQTWITLFSLSLAFGTEILVGHCIGAGRWEDAYRSVFKSVRTALLIVVSGSVLLGAAAPRLIAAFTDDQVIIDEAASLLRIAALLESGRVFNLVVIYSLRAVGDARFPMLMAIGSMWGLWVPLAWLLGLQLGLGLMGVWIAMICDEWCRALVMFWRWRGRSWMEHARRSRAEAGGLSESAEAS